MASRAPIIVSMMLRLSVEARKADAISSFPESGLRSCDSIPVTIVLSDIDGFKGSDNCEHDATSFCGSAQSRCHFIVSRKRLEIMRQHSRNHCLVGYRWLQGLR